MVIFNFPNISKASYIRYAFAFAIAICIVLLFSSNSLTLFQDGSWTNEGLQTTLKKAEKSSSSDIPVFALAVCQKQEGDPARKKELFTDIHRQMEQILVFIKSTASLSKSLFRIILIVDSDLIFNSIINTTSSWPSAVRNKFELSKAKVWFPETRDKLEFRRVYLVCSIARFYLLESLPEVDSVIYFDTDILFLRPPEELWDEFRYFDSKQLAGISVKFPTVSSAPAKLELNSGVWMMNLTRMRDFPGGWVQKSLDVYDVDKLARRGANDQAMAEKIFTESPQYLYLLSCKWNFRSAFCKGLRGDGNDCFIVSDEGASMLHGNGASFYRDQPFQIIFNAWRDFDLNNPLSTLLDSIEKSFREIGEIKLKMDCGHLKGIQNILTKGLVNHVQSLYP